MQTPAVTGPSESSVKSGAIRLQIAGGDLLLAGRFEHWMPVLLNTEDGVGVAQLLVDVTSNRNRAISAGRDLISFKAKTVESVGPQSYRMKGTLRADGHSQEVEALLQSPPGHTPFFVILFRFDPTSFADLWNLLEEKAIQAGPMDKDELRPSAWLRAPALAAA